MIFLYLSVFISAINTSSIKILLPNIMVDLEANINWLTWTVNAFTLPFAIFLPVFGRLVDIYGPRRFFRAGVATLGVGSILCGLAPTFEFLLFARVVQGLGAAQIAPASMVLLLAVIPEEQRGQKLGIFGSVMALGTLAGPIIAGVLVDLVSWRSNFFVVVPLLVLLLAASFKSPFFSGQEKDSTPRAVNFDYSGTLSFITASMCFLLALTFMPDLGWRNPLILGLLVASLLSFYAFFRIERRASHPFIDLKIFRDKRFSLGMLVTFFAEFVAAGTIFLMPLFFILAKGFSAIETALLLMPTAITLLIMAPLGGRISDRIGYGIPITAGMIIRGVSFLLLSWITIDTGYLLIAGYLVLNGIGVCLTVIPALNAVFSAIDPQHRGVVGSLNNMIRFYAISLGTTACGIMLYALIPSSFEGLIGPVPGFSEVFIFCAALCIPGLLFGIKMLPERRAGETGVPSN